MKRFFTLCLVGIFMSAGVVGAQEKGEERFKPTWESVGVKDDAPEWLKDAKFGIYTHWGPQTWFGDLDVSGSIGYYNNIYVKGSPCQEYHLKHYGDPSKVGYKDVIDRFKAKDFDPEVWAETFYEAGARFAGMVVIHHDNVAMWDSSINPYNVAKLGPRRDVTGELAAAYRKRKMHFLATFHSLGSWGHSYLGAYDQDGKDPATIPLYNEPHKKDDKPFRSYLDRNLDLIKEVVGKYEPDGIWFDYGLYNALEEKDRLHLASYYYNWGLDHEKDVVFIHKHGTKLPTGILNTERGRRGEMLEKTWMNDESIGVRYWYLNRERKNIAGNFSAKYLMNVIIDLASKNGTFLLNVAPDKNGMIPDDQMEILRGIGGWLKKYGESIYATRPWNAYGEGPFQVRFPGKISGSNPGMREYSARDIRFTRSKDGKTVYAIFMGPPEPGIPILSMKVTDAEALKECRWIGHGAVRVTVDEKARPVVDISSIKGDASKDFSYAIAFPAKAIAYNPEGVKARFPVVSLSVDEAVVTGESIRLETIDADDGIRALRPWKDPADFVSWNVDVPEGGTWVVEATAKARGNTRVRVVFGGREHVALMDSRRMKSGKPVSVDFGSFRVEKPGKQVLEIRAVKTGGNWYPLELYGVKLKRVH